MGSAFKDFFFVVNPWLRCNVIYAQFGGGGGELKNWCRKLTQVFLSMIVNSDDFTYFMKTSYYYTP